jgi:putative dehydrogenase
MTTTKRQSAATHQPPQAVGVLGLGIMGSALSANLVKAGFEVHGHDPVGASRQRLKQAGGRVWAQAAQVLSRCEVVITSLPSAQALEQVTQTLLAHGQAGTVVMETSTLAVDDKRRAQQALARRGLVMLDCPLSGTGAQAVNKDLTVYASGPKAAIRRVVPVMEGFAREHFDLGAFGNGMRMKLMANLLVAIHNVSTAEALLLGEQWGIPIEQAVRVLSGGAGGSRMLQVRGPMMTDRQWEQATMKVSVWQKDMHLIQQALVDAKVGAPLFAATQPIYNAALGLGHAEHDTASVIEVLRRMKGA